VIWGLFDACLFGAYLIFEICRLVLFSDSKAIPIENRPPINFKQIITKKKYRFWRLDEWLVYLTYWQAKN
jgi:hypothetical protein